MVLASTNQLGSDAIVEVKYWLAGCQRSFYRPLMLHAKDVDRKGHVRVEERKKSTMDGER